MANFGSAGWSNADEYPQDSKLHARAINFVAKVNWAALTLHASKLRSGTACYLSDKFSLGHFNLVRQIAFEDGELWIARLRLPELHEVFGARETLDAQRSMQIEIATTNYIRTKTSVPVPQIFGSNLDTNSDVGAPYLFMSYIHGNVASELRMTRESEAGLFGTPDQDQRFRRQMASVQVQLACLRFERIGSIYQDGDSFAIGPEIETGLGPWDSPDQYFKDLAHYVMKVAGSEAEPEVRESPSFYLPNTFVDLIQRYGNCDATGPFSVVNRDFGAHNILVDSDFNIIGVIDLDGVMAAPVEIVAQFPQLTGLDLPLPGSIETRPAALERMKMVAPQLKEYQNLVHNLIAEKSNSGDALHVSRLAELMMSNTAIIVEGLKSYRGHQKYTNDQWVMAYQRLQQASPSEEL